MPTPADLQRTLAKQMLKANAAKVIDVFQTWDVDGSGTISKKEFRQAVQPLLGLPAGPEVLDELFDMFDDDRSGEITLKELNNVLRRGQTVELDASLQAGARGKIKTSATVRYQVRKGKAGRGTRLAGTDLDRLSIDGVPQDL